MKTICYPHAYGSLDAQVRGLVDKFKMHSHLDGIACSEEQLNLLQKLVNEMRDRAYEEAVEHHESISKQSSGSYTGSIVGFSGL
jgi:hypothetical protein